MERDINSLYRGGLETNVEVISYGFSGVFYVRFKSFLEIDRDL